MYNVKYITTLASASDLESVIQSEVRKRKTNTVC